MSRLRAINVRKRVENARRRRFAQVYEGAPRKGADGHELLRRDGALRVIAEIKYASPSAGTIRTWAPGDERRVAASYEAGGASAISVLTDRVGFGGTPLRVRRIAAASRLPVLYKGFVLEPLQLDLARAMDATFVLLIVRSMDASTLHMLVEEALTRGLVPIVEAADGVELAHALDTDERAVVGVNARDLRTFRVDMDGAAKLVGQIPAQRVAVQMSGVRTREDFERVAGGRADAVLVGEGLMRAEDPAARLRAWLE